MDDDPEDVRVEKRPMRIGYVLVALFAVVGGTIVFGAGGSDEQTRRPPETSAPATASTTTTGLATVTEDGTLVDVHPELVGRPLEAPTGLEILVGGTLVEVDEQRSTWVGGLADRPEGLSRILHSFSVGDASVIVRVFACEGCEQLESRVLVLEAGATRSQQVGAGTDIFASPGREGIWIKTYETEDECTLEKVDLAGGVVEPPRPWDCDLHLIAETDLGLHAREVDGPHALFDPADLQAAFVADEILAVAGQQVLVRDADADYRMLVLSGELRAFHSLEYEASLIRERRGPGANGDPIPGPVSPDGRYAAVEFVGPQGDLWLFDFDTSTWQHPPGFPVEGHARTIHPQWTDDGRLVVFGALLEGLGDERDLTLATWTPGDDEMAVRRVDYPPGPLLVR